MALGLQRFFRHTAVYTIGNLVYRGASFLLIPVYLHHLSTAEYGSLEIIFVTAAILQIAFGAGIPHSALRFYFEYDKSADKNAVISTALIGSFVFTLAGALLLALFAPMVAGALFSSPSYAVAFRIMAISMVFEISREISLALVRSAGKPGLFVIISLVQLTVQVLANLYLILVLHKGIVGILTGNLIATTTVWMVLTGFTLRTCGWHFAPQKVKAILNYGGPLMVSALSWSVFESLDRYFLNAYRGLDSTGIYALALRFAALTPILLVVPFTNSYGPFRFEVMNQSHANHIYSKVLTYYTFLSTFLVLGIAILSREVIQLISSPAYWPAYRIVPLAVIPGALSGIGYCFETGIFIKKRTDRMLAIAVASGLFNLVLVRLLIPRWGIYGAAVSGLLFALFQVLCTFVVAQKLYPVKYEFGRIAKILLAAVLVGAAAFHLPLETLWHALLAKVLLLALFPLLLLLMRVCTPDEKAWVKEFWAKTYLRSQSKAVTQW